MKLDNDGDTTDEIEDFDETEDEEEDPLFGKFENNKDLKLLLSPKKKKRTEDVVVSRKRQAEEHMNSSKKPKGRMDILAQLQVHMRDPLDKELGFSMKKNLTQSSTSVKNSTELGNLIEEVKRERQIKELIADETKSTNKQREINDDISNWISKYVDSDFLNIENNGVKVHAQWISQLKKNLKNIISKNGDKSDFEWINSKILENSQYCVFKCFTNRGIINNNYDNDIVYMFDEFSVNNILRTIDIQYIENFPSEFCDIKTDESNKDFTEILKGLGFSIELISANNKAINKTFDNKKQLPVLGCGLQILKFVKLLEIGDILMTFKFRDILKTLILMSIDYNVEQDIRRFYYKIGRYTGKEIAMIKIQEYQEEIKSINDVLNGLFLINCPDLWFKFIRNIRIKGLLEDKIFKSQLILRFLKDNQVGDGVKIYNEFEAVFDNQHIVTTFINFLEEMSFEKFTLEHENLSNVVYMKIQLIEDFIIMNNEMIAKCKIDDKFSIVEKSIHRLKNHYFKDYQNKSNAIIPKCRKILDFISHEISNIEFEDFFVDESEVV